MLKNPPVALSLGWKDPLEKGMATHPVFLPGKSHGKRSLVGYSPWCCKELDTSEQAYMHCSKQPFGLELRLLTFYLFLTASSQPRV